MANSKDILLSCYDGKIVALVDAKKFKRQGIMGQEDNKALEDVTGQDKDKTKRIAEMKLEVQALEKQLAKLEDETNKVVEKTKNQKGGQQSQLGEQFKVNYKMNLLPLEGSYMLIIDSQYPVAQIILQSKQNVDILSVKNNIAKIHRI